MIEIETQEKLKERHLRYIREAVLEYILLCNKWIVSIYGLAIFESEAKKIANQIVSDTRLTSMSCHALIETYYDGFSQVIRPIIVEYIAKWIDKYL